MYEDRYDVPCYACKGTGRAEPEVRCSRCDGSGQLVGNISTEEKKRRSSVRAHHVIPRWYQKRFANSDGTLFFCDKHEGRVRETGPNVLFVKKDAYQVREKGTGAMIVDCEHEFAILDARNNKAVSDLLDRITESEGKGHTTIDLNREPLEVLASNLLVRNPTLFGGSIARVSAKEKSRADQKDHAAIERGVKIAMTGVVISISQDPLGFLRNTRIGIGRTPRGEQLIIGDHLMPNLSINHHRIFGLPLDSTTLVLWEHDLYGGNRSLQLGIAGRGQIVKLSRYNTRAFNRGILEGSKTIAGSSRRTIEALVTAHRRRHHPSNGTH